MANRHTIVLMQASQNRASRTFMDFDSISQAMDGICGLYERKLKEINPTIVNITYDIADLYNFVDGYADLSALVFEVIPTLFTAVRLLSHPCSPSFSTVVNPTLLSECNIKNLFKIAGGFNLPVFINPCSVVLQRRSVAGMLFWFFDFSVCLGVSGLLRFEMNSFSITRKKTPFQKHREEEEAKRRAEDETARLYAEFVESFQGSDVPGSKAFCSRRTINLNEKIKTDSEGTCHHFFHQLPEEESLRKRKEDEKPKGEKGKPRVIDNFLEELKAEQELREKRNQERDQFLVKGVITITLVSLAALMSFLMISIQVESFQDHLMMGIHKQQNLYVETFHRRSMKIFF
ncbi:hypothetical protein HPP92_017465 [Vanilla planifolia]|uniref:Uncharacterized protein n=1 Tax=Vanilla planifolia TaxID=51239 RepID=A0A835QCT8_VANPL|nr:hypothetical protein HPP92_017465 [Vanilla planifolia]